MPRKYAACSDCEGLGRWFGSPLNSPGPDAWHPCWECGGTGRGREIYEHEEREDDDERV